MADKTEAEKKADAEKEESVKTDEKLDKLLTCMDAVMSRMDAFEEKEKARDDAAKAKADADKKAGMSAEEVAADKAKKDAEAKAKADAEEKEKEEKAEKEKADAIKADAEETRKRIDAIEKMLPKERTDADISTMTDAQARADSVYRAFGKAAPRFLNGEDEMSYRRRLVREFQSHSPTWKPVDLGVIADATAFKVAEDAIYADAMAAAMDPRGADDVGLRMVRGETSSGHKETKFYGRPSAWLGRFAGAKRFATKINPLVRQEMN